MTLLHTNTRESKGLSCAKKVCWNKILVYRASTLLFFSLIISWYSLPHKGKKIGNCFDVHSTAWHVRKYHCLFSAENKFGRTLISSNHMISICPRTTDAKWSLFYWNPELLGLARQIGQISIIQPLFLQKTKPLYPHSKYLFGIGIWLWATKIVIK